MTPSTSRVLVLDANILGQAGSEESQDPRSAHCYEFLRQIYAICHRVILSTAIREEWARHASPRARRWLRFMFGKKKKILEIDIPPNEALREHVQKAISSKSASEKASEDIHLLEAALATDGLIVSLDDTAKEIFHQCCGRVRQIRHVVWINPAQPESDPLGWLRAGAPAEARRSLGHL